MDEKYRIASDDLEHTTEHYNHIKEEYEQIQAEIEALEEAINAARDTLSNTGVLRERLEGEINVLKEQINSAHSNAEHLQNRKKSVLDEIEGKNKDKEGILADKDDIDKQVQDITRSRDEIKQRLEEVQNQIEELNNSIETGKNTIIGELNQRATIKSKMGRFDSMLENINIRKAELNSRILRAKSDERIKQLEDNFAAICEEIRGMHEKEASIELEVGKKREQLAQTDQKLRETQNSFHQEKSKLEALSNLTERYEGYGGSVKRVMEQKDKEKGIVGVVADIIKVDKKGNRPILGGDSKVIHVV